MALSLRSPQDNNSAAQKLAMERFDTALAQRSKFHLTFDPSVTTLSNLSTSLLEFSGKTLTMELLGPKAVPQGWVGAAVTCYFRITDRANRSVHVFYSFATRVEKIEQKGEGVAILSLRTPEALQRSQRRQSLRIQVDLSHFGVLTFWVFTQEGFNRDSPLLNLDIFSKKLARVDNLSAGGMRLLLTGPLLKNLPVPVEKGAKLILQMHIRDPQGWAEDPYWIIARVSNSAKDFVTKDVTLGLEFIAEGQINAETGKVNWKKVVDNVITGIGKWTYKWNLEIYRDKGISND